MQQHQSEKELHRHTGLSPEHRQRFLEDGFPGKLSCHCYDYQGGGARQGTYSLTQVL